MAARRCVTQLDLPSKESNKLSLRIQNSAIAPGNGGELVKADVL